MIPIKSEQEIAMMREGGRKLAWVFGKVLAEIKPGAKINELDELAEKLIKKQGGKPSFKMVKGYSWATCINVNQGVVHGIPNDYQLKLDDLVSLDMGIFFKGFHTDMARTIRVDGREGKFLQVGKAALKKAIEVARPGKRIGHISAVIGKEIKKAGYSPIRNLTGHGVGKTLHQEPQIPCFSRERISATALIEPGMTLAIEVIYAQGKPDLRVTSDDWTVETADSRPAALFEDTVAIGSKKAEVLTSLPRVKRRGRHAAFRRDE